MTSKKVLRTTFAAVSAATLTILATPGIALAAPGVGVVGQDSDLTRMPQKANLTVHKYTSGSQDGDPVADGTNKKPNDATSKPIEGVTFSAYKVEGLDLNTNEGWVIAKKLVADWQSRTTAEKRNLDKKLSYTENGTKHEYTINKTAAWSGKTNANGEAATTQKLPAGLYVIIESIPDATVKIKGEANPVAAGSIVQSAPFIVALPLTQPRDPQKPDAPTVWNDNVHVFPKNSQTGIEKSVEDAGTRGTGNTGNEVAKSTVRYTLKGDIPKGYKSPTDPSPTAKKFQNFQLLDKFADEVNYAGSDVVTFQDGTDKSTRPASGSPYELVKGTDYNITISPTVTPIDGSKHVDRALVTLTDAGLDKMAKWANGKSEPKLVWELNAVFATPANIPGKLKNTGYVIPDYPNGGTTGYNVTDNKIPPVPPAETESHYGKVNVLKVEAGTDKALDGVEFKLWVCNKQGEKLKLDGSANPGADDNVWVGGKDTWTTNAEGKFSIAGLRANDWKNDSSKTEGYIPKADQDYYCLEETKTKAGYEKLPQMIQFQILSVTKTGQTDPADNQTEDVNWTRDLKVENVPTNGGFDLPLTGGAGVWPLIGLGGLLVAGSAGYAAWASRRKTAQA